MRLGIFGGTFNPIHNGHIAVAKKVYDSFGLARVHFVPSHVPAHKYHGLASPEHRINMLTLALSDKPWAKCNDLEYHRTGKSYTRDTLLEIQKSYPKAELYFIIGEDSLQTLHSWHRWEDILSLAKLVVVPRAVSKTTIHPVVKSYLYDNKLAFIQSKQGIFRLLVESINISSTSIRSQEQAAESVPPLVWEYLSRHHLYF